MSEDELVRKTEEAYVVLEGQVGPKLEQMICSPISRVLGRRICPFVASQATLDSMYVPGDYQVVSAALEGIPALDESKLSWEQVIEVRRDSESWSQLKRFLRWVDTIGQDHTIAQVTESIQLQLHDYKEALRKHGCATVIGTIKSTLDPRAMVASLIINQSLGSPLSPAVVLGSFGVKFLIEYLNIRFNAPTVPCSEVAYLYSIEQHGRDLAAQQARSEISRGFSVPPT